jgi:hypothetical protein
MPGKGKKNRDARFRAVVAGMVALAAVITAVGGGGSGGSVTAGDPTGCVVLKVSP